MKSRVSNLIKLGDTGDYKVAENNIDIRGWAVVGSMGTKLGKVTDLIVDKDKEKVRYLMVKIDARYPDIEDKEILVPVGLVNIIEDNKVVTLREINADKVRAYPTFTGELTRDYEYSVRDYLSRPTSRAEIFADRLSPAREESIREDVRHNILEQQNELIQRLKDERDQALNQRDQAMAENERLQKELIEYKMKYDSGKDQNEDPFYKHWYFECDEFESGRRC